MHNVNAHGPDSARIHRIARRYADMRERASLASSQGDASGAMYAAAEARRLRRILAEG
jgi:hypothetical protein